MLTNIKKLRNATNALVETLRDELGLTESNHTKPTEALFDNYSLSHYLPDEVYDAEADIYPYKQATHMMFECSTLIGASEETVTLLTSILTDILPPDSVLHALFWASPKIGPMIDEMESLRSQGSEVLNALAKRRSAFYRNGVYRSLTKESHFMLRDFRLFLCVSIPRKNIEDDRLLLTTLREDITKESSLLNLSRSSPISAYFLLKFLTHLAMKGCLAFWPSSAYLASSTAMTLSLSLILIAKLKRKGQVICKAVLNILPNRSPICHCMGDFGN